MNIFPRKGIAIRTDRSYNHLLTSQYAHVTELRLCLVRHSSLELLFFFQEEQVGNQKNGVTFDRVMDDKLARNLYPDFTVENNSSMRQVLTPELFEQLKDHKTATGSWTLAQTINTGIKATGVSRHRQTPLEVGKDRKI